MMQSRISEPQQCESVCMQHAQRWTFIIPGPATPAAEGTGLHGDGPMPAAVPMAVKSLWSASFLKNPPNLLGISQRSRPPSMDVSVLQQPGAVVKM